MSGHGRYFFALFPDPGVRLQLLTTMSAEGIRVHRPVAPENLHITLVYLGMADKSAINKLINGINGVHASPFQLEIDLAGWWRGTKIAWLAPSVWPSMLDGLVAGITMVWHESGGRQVAGRPYKPHITIGRRQPHPISAKFAPIPWEIRDFHLVKSFTRPEGAEYKIIQTWALS